MLHNTQCLRARTSKSRHLLRCQMLRCQDQCPRCPMFPAGGQSGFGTSLTQLVSATPCQQTELMYEKGQRQHINTHGTEARFMYFDSSESSYPLAWTQYISVRLSFHTRQSDLVEMWKIELLCSSTQLKDSFNNMSNLTIL